MQLKDLFSFDQLANGVRPLYKVYRSFRPYIITDENYSVMPCVGSYAKVPLLSSSKVDIECAIAALLLHCSKNDEALIEDPDYATNDCEVFFKLADIEMGGIVTGGPVPTITRQLPNGNYIYLSLPVIVSEYIPKDVMIAVAPPINLGRIVQSGDKIGFLLYGRHGVHRFRVVGRRNYSEISPTRLPV
ncbi:MAG TPA: hypothetical protein VIE65_10840 [Methylobacter sp.]